MRINFIKKSLVMVVIDQFSRHIIRFVTHREVLSDVVVCCLFNKIISIKNLPEFLSSDHHPVFNYFR